MTSKQNNYLREREKANARSPFSKRTPERVIMCAGAVYSVGMAIFFALSGFLLFRPWVTAAAAGSDAPSAARYAHRRLRRVMPAYLATVLLAYGVYSVFSSGPNPGQSLAGLLRHPTLTQIYTDNYLMTHLHRGLSQTWSLAVEVAFYAVLPLLAYLLVVVLCGDRWRPARLLAGLAGLAAISLGWQVVLVTTDWLPNSAGMWLPAHLASFAVGMGLAVLAEAGVRCPATVTLPLAFGAFLLVSTPVAGAVAMGPVRVWEPLIKTVLYAAVAALFLDAAPFAGVPDALGPVLFAGLVSTGVGYTLQVVAQ